MTNQNNDPFHGVPDHWLAVIIHFVTGFHNVSGKEFSDPIIKPDLQNIYPLFVIQYAFLSIFGVISNVYIIYYILRYKLYRDVTHAFIMNLGLCHIIECGIVLPITLMVIIVQNWIYGQFMCFFLPLLQDIPLHVAIISHLLIAWDRMRWLGDPLKARLPSFVCSCATWLTGMVIALPYPIYTTYLDLGLYLPKFRGVGICAINLVDDMQEYMRGLFVIMYCAPATVLAYLYIRTSRELRPPEGPLGVMMFEHRADVRNNQRTSSSTPSATRTGTRTSYSRSYDLYDAELDVTREKRTQRHLGAMAATQIICTCPLMILRIARMVLSETYENTSHLDITYLMFVWIGFIPTFINPCIYAAWMLSRPAKERLRGYFRLSSRRDNKKPSNRSPENSVTQEHTTETCDEPAKLVSTEVVNKSSDKLDKSKGKAACENSSQKLVKSKNIENFRRLNSGLGLIDSKSAIIEPINNSCSNITSSTYCNGGDVNSYYDKNPLCDRDSLYSVVDHKSASRPSLQRSQDLLSEIDLGSRRESSSTYDRDMEIIDLLERERSMDIQDMMEREKRGERIRSISRHNSSFERHHRKLPDISKLTTPISPKKIDSNFPNLVFTHQNEYAAKQHLHDSQATTSPLSAIGRAPIPPMMSSSGAGSRKSSQSSYSKRDSINSIREDVIYPDVEPLRNVPINRIGRTRSITSASKTASIKSRDRRIVSCEYRDSSYSQNL